MFFSVGGCIELPIPDFIDNYHLPPGEHECTFMEIEKRFLTTSRRKMVWQLFINFLERLRFLNIFPDSILIDGSFVTGREEPGDVDVCLLIPPEKLINAYDNLGNDEDRESLKFIFNPKNQKAVRLISGAHLLIAFDENSMSIFSDIFRTGGEQFHHNLRPPDKERDPEWVKTPVEKGILKVNFV